MKNTRIILSIIFLSTGAGTLIALASANAGGSNVLGNFLLSGYSYMAYAIPLFYFWFFTLFFVGKPNIKRVIWPVMGIFPFVLFTLALRVQLWDGFNSTSPLIEHISNFFGKDNAVILLSFVGLLVVITEVLLYGISLYKKTVLHADTLADSLTDTLEDKIHTIEEKQNRLATMSASQNNIHKRKYSSPPAMKRSPRMPSNLPQKRPYNQTPAPIIAKQVPAQAVAPSAPVSNTPAPSEDEFVLVFNKKKNSIKSNPPHQRIEETDNTMLGVEGYINTESLNHIDFEKEKEKNNHQERLNTIDTEIYERAEVKSPVAYTDVSTPIDTYTPVHSPNETSDEIANEIGDEIGDELVEDIKQAADTITEKSAFYEDEFYNEFFEDEEETEKTKDFIAEDIGGDSSLHIEDVIEFDDFSDIDIEDDFEIRIDEHTPQSALALDTEANIVYEDHIDDETEEPIFAYDIERPIADMASDMPFVETVDRASEDEKMYEHKISKPTMKEKKRKRRGGYHIPIIGLLDPPEETTKIDDSVNERIANLLESTLLEFKIEAKVTAICRGPVVTMFEILPAHGVRLRKIVELSDNIALRLAAPSIRIVAPIPGKEAVGIEVPNEIRDAVSFSELVSVKKFVDKTAALPVALGKNISNDMQIMDLSKTPHLLIAGATGSGKSVCVNSIITSLLYRCPPDEVKLILIDPKIVELSFYNGIAHLLTPVISDAAKSLQALRWCVEEMERRYRELESLNVREIKSYNKKLKDSGASKKIGMPFIVVIIDEFADLMMTCGKEIETLVARLTAKSRAIGIHLVIATQRPSTDVITGLIKSNIPTRISFMVTSKTDSRIILDMNGAENLLGKGDMLYSSASDPFPERIQGPYLSEEEVENVVEYVKAFAGEPDYISDEIFAPPEQEERATDEYTEDPLWDAVIEEVMRVNKASASHLQRRFKIGYNRAARLVEDMEERGIIGPQQGSKPREVYADNYA